MMDIFDRFFSLLLGTAVVIILGLTIYMLIVSRPGKALQLSQATKAEMQYEMVLECQQMSAVATNENWSYASCLKNLKDAKSFSELRAL